MLENFEQPRTISLPWGNHSLDIRYIDFGKGSVNLYLHGWGQNHGAFLPLIDALKDQGRHVALDFPGFGDSSFPPDVWGVSDYAHFVQKFIRHMEWESCFLITHSFGGRVALRFANQWPDQVHGLFLIAAAGLPNPIPFRKRIRIQTIRTLARSAQRWIPGTLGEKIKQSLYDKIASRDYKQAGVLRPIFVKVVNDDVSDILPAIPCPVTLLYGSEDTETPPSIGYRMQQRLPHAQYIEIPGFDHYSILTRGRHQVGHQIRTFLQQIQGSRSMQASESITNGMNS